ncbi:EutP/PduV family microcompartment system protein [Enterococcus caccae]|uniref:DNA topology modulation protein FlaR n=1 Tax=Enterococcus caccae ATCC BAA-1240 TaxID=1158612 RepID=R3WR35_9ENTE|nr:EutP/PduV family microcompartment system protein [Enterococcus caccae]EOL44295.1 hypothetical protein UC7_02339 [Enterococcus caccae ATCC BAA-1240]EOT68589.1 hypothetical protein I580_00972 [Enterococcus caccae ATCC BAA-1240]OJG28196.1 hypothetical protein RU98_GL001444 [Enterococcus caccae]
MKKIMIAGPVGSGKTTFAKQLSAEKKIPYYELDNLIWNRLPAGDQPYPVEESIQQLQEILTEECWIIEGTTTKDWIKPALEAADILFLLLPPYHIRIYRILHRFIKQITKQEKAHYKPTIHLLKMMFRWNHHFEKKNVFELQKLIKCSPEKLLIVKSKNAYLSSKHYLVKEKT